MPGTNAVRQRDAVIAECPFCAIPTAFCLLSHGSVIAMLDQHPVSAGHTLIIPRRHITAVFDLTAAERVDVWHLVMLVRAGLLEQDPLILGFNVGTNVGEVAGQTVSHAHIHVIPRRSGDTPNPRGGVRGVIPEKMDY